MIPTKRMPTISSDVAMGRRMKGAEIPPAISVSRSGLGLDGSGARVHRRRGLRLFVDQRAIEQARLPGHDDPVSDVQAFGDHGVCVAALVDLDRPGVDLAVVAYHIGEQSRRPVLHAILWH